MLLIYPIFHRSVKEEHHTLICVSTVVFGKYIVPLFDELNETFKRSYDKPSYIKCYKHVH